MSLAGKNLLDGPAPTYLPEETELLAAVADGASAAETAQKFPKSSLAWANLAEETLAEGKLIEGYAFARVGYHRGLDVLRGNGWKGHGAIPFSHEPNRGFLKALNLLGKAAAEIGETDEAQRIEKFLNDSDPEAAAQLN
ncbi:DUF3151 domain-containing protein [Rothia sp. ZJ932]|uniref:DUF3151 domain-containing protein n=1 Tax=Rothia sp. ZJ932 TaxID=2810516 RepID=UPI001967D6F9|nr:DUF3151 domain-containing protein [Rothia sp. ZJ932]QRZ61727.1 DUF3151 domain-containing protein [Rothia sp. ZJ932]